MAIRGHDCPILVQAEKAHFTPQELPHKDPLTKVNLTGENLEHDGFFLTFLLLWTKGQAYIPLLRIKGLSEGKENSVN